MEDRIVVENDDAMAKKRKNVLFYSIFVVLLLVYSYYSYLQYLENPDEFKVSRLLFRMLFFIFFIIPGIISNVIRFSTIDEIPYASITKYERDGTLFNWNGAMKLYLINNKIRTLWLNKEEMKRFRFLLDQKLLAFRPVY